MDSKMNTSGSKSQSPVTEGSDSDRPRKRAKRKTYPWSRALDRCIPTYIPRDHQKRFVLQSSMVGRRDQQEEFYRHAVKTLIHEVQLDHDVEEAEVLPYLNRRLSDINGYIKAYLAGVYVIPALPLPLSFLMKPRHTPGYIWALTWHMPRSSRVWYLWVFCVMYSNKHVDLDLQGDPKHKASTEQIRWYEDWGSNPLKRWWESAVEPEEWAATREKMTRRELDRKVMEAAVLTR